MEHRYRFIQSSLILMLFTPTLTSASPNLPEKEINALNTCIDAAAVEESQKTSPDASNVMAHCQTEYENFQAALAPNASTSYKQYLNNTLLQAAARKLNEALNAEQSE